MRRLIIIIFFLPFILQGQGTEKISNGTFDSSTDWTIINSGYTIGGGVASFDGITASYLKQASADMVSVIEDSLRYMITFDISTAHDTCFAYIRIYGSNHTPIYKVFTKYYDGSYKVFITTPNGGNDGGIEFYATTTGDAFDIDNISVIELPALTGGPYFVATAAEGGDDINDGSIGSPWASWARAVNAAVPGDTVYFRGGIYYKQLRESWRVSSDDGLGLDGERGNPISYIGYPSDITGGDSIIFDCSLMYIPFPDTVGIEAEPPTATTKSVAGLLCDADFIVFKGFTIRNVYQKRRYVQTTGFNMSSANNLRVENVVLHDVSGHGFYYSPWWSSDGRDSTIFLNNDAYNCVDSFSINVANYRDLPGSPQAGTWGNGFMITVVDKIHADTSSYVQFLNNRAWHNADEGINFTSLGTSYIQDNWSFANGYYLSHGVYDGQTSGNGWKANGAYFEGYSDSLIVQYYFYNNLAAFNFGYGHGENNNGKVSLNREVYSNTMYKNYIGFQALDQGDTREYGLYKNKYVNNISYDSRYAELTVGAEGHMYVNEYNSWTTPPGVTVTDADFVVTDSATAVAQMKAARKADGSLPDITFLTLVLGSDLIDAGTNVELPYYGAAPDLGYNEYEPGGSPTPPVAGFTANSTSILTRDYVVYTDTSTNTPTGWDWTFEGGNPSASNAQNPTVYYYTPGVFDVSLTASNGDGGDSKEEIDYIDVTKSYKISIKIK